MWYLVDRRKSKCLRQERKKSWGLLSSKRWKITNTFGVFRKEGKQGGWMFPFYEFLIFSVVLLYIHWDRQQSSSCGCTACTCHRYGLLAVGPTTYVCTYLAADVTCKKENSRGKTLKQVLLRPARHLRRRRLRPSSSSSSSKKLLLACRWKISLQLVPDLAARLLAFSFFFLFLGPPTACCLLRLIFTYFVCYTLWGMYVFCLLLHIPARTVLLLILLLACLLWSPM